MSVPFRFTSRGSRASAAPTERSSRLPGDIGEADLASPAEGLLRSADRPGVRAERGDGYTITERVGRQPRQVRSEIDAPAAD